MTDVRDLGASGKTVFDTAQRLQKAGLVDDAQFKELTNSNVGPQDVAIANQALDKIKSSTPDVMSLMMSIPKMNNAILDIQRGQLQQHLKEAAPKPDAAGAVQKSLGDTMGGFMHDFLDAIAKMPTSKQIIQNIKV